MDGSRSERLRYFFPGVYLAVAVALIHYQSIFSNTQMSTGTSVFVLGAGGLIGGFLLNKATNSTVFRKFSGLNQKLTPHGNELVKIILNNQLHKYTVDEETRKNLLGIENLIFDEFINHNCSDKVVDRFFYLNDMESSFITLTFACLIVTFTGFFEVISQININFPENLWTFVTAAYFTNLFLLHVFHKGAIHFYIASRQYSRILILAYYKELTRHIEKIINNQKTHNTILRKLPR